MTGKYPLQPDDKFLQEIIHQAIIWSREAGQIAMHYFNNVTVDYKPDDTLLTRADIEIEHFLVKQIRAAFPDHNLVGEEGRGDIHRLASPYTWVIDPLDGTTAFVQGLPGWGVSLGLLYVDQPIFGLFYMPLLNDLTYATITNQPVHYQTVKHDWRNKGFLAVSTGAHHDYKIDLPRIRALGSVGASLVYTARGSATAAFIPKAYLWDLVAGALILNQAGGQLRYITGRPVDYALLLDGRLTPEPIIAGHPYLLNEVQQAIQPAKEITGSSR